ncbi:MAG: hypothetical protein WCP16_09995 [Pseudanabaena sp. ELA645]|jgi:hypothetical protein
MMQETNNKNQFYPTTPDADAYSDKVDNLMDDLFGEVETALHVDQNKQRSLKQKNRNQASAPYASINSSSSDMVAIANLDPSERDASTSKDTVNITKLNLTDISLPPISKQDLLWIEPYITRNPEPPTPVPPTEFAPELQKPNLLDRILLVAACSSALIAAIMWTINHGIWLGRQSVSVATINQKTIPDNKPFAEEIRRMLADISDKNRAIAMNPNANIGSNIPLMTAPLLGNMPLPIGTNPLANGMQQPMYVPVYQPPSLNNNGNLPSPLALPPATSNNSIIVANPTSNPKAKKPSPVTVTNTPTPAYTPPEISYTLIGSLDLGDRSSAMFDMNGAVQTVGLGKAIGNTGWSLSRVSQQEIILKRGKETKTLFVGQKF